VCKEQASTNEKKEYTRKKKTPGRAFAGRASKTKKTGCNIGGGD